MTTITEGEIAAGLRDLGLNEGDRVLVHSSLSSFGYVEGGADAVIDALLAVIGDSGTLMTPTLTGSRALSPDNPPVFDPAASPGWTGRIPETFRQRPGVIRSLHATHSVAAFGPDAEWLTGGHDQSITPCDAESPYGRLAQLRRDARILLLGVDHESNTTFHHVEEIVGVDYVMQPGLAAAQIRTGDTTTTRHIMLHAYGTPRRFMVMEPLFIERGIQQTGKIGAATVRLIDARRMVEVTTQCLRGNHRILCDSAPAASASSS